MSAFVEKSGYVLSVPRFAPFSGVPRFRPPVSPWSCIQSGSEKILESIGPMGLDARKTL